MYRFKKFISLFLSVFMFLGTAALIPFSAFAAGEISLGKEQTVNIGSEGKQVYFSFIPEKTLVYEFISVSEAVDPCGYIYNSDMELMYSCDDKEEEESLDFSIAARLIKGKKYYLSAALFEGSKGSFKVLLRAYEGIFVEDFTGDIEVKPGESFVLTTNAYSNSGELNYQWDMEYLSFDKNGEYFWEERILQDGKSNSLSIAKAKMSGHIKCIISDPHGNHKDVWFEVHLNSGLKAEIQGNEFRDVVPGSNETLSVCASSEVGSVHYKWYKEYKVYTARGDYDWERKLISGEEKNSLTLVSPSEGASYCCLVYDDYNNIEEIWFYVSMNSGFTASAAGNTSLSVKPGSSLTLSVNAAVNKGKIHYQWYKKQKSADSERYVIEKLFSGTSKDITLKNLKYCADYVCFVSDDYGNFEYVLFSVSILSGFKINSPHITELTVGAGISATLSVNAVSDAPLSYQWGSSYGFENNGAFENGTGPQFTTPSVYDCSEIYCRVTDACGNEDTVWFYLTPDSGMVHKFDEPFWIWNSDYSSAKAKFVCKSESAHIQFVDAEITKTVTSATCTSDGKTVYTASASFYGKTYTASISVAGASASGHKWNNGIVTRSATEIKEGVKTFTCSVCGTKRTESIPKLSVSDLGASELTEKDGYLYVRPELTCAEIIKTAGKGSKLLKPNGSLLKSDEKAGSGMTLIKTNGTILTVIVKGDCDCDGEITASDARIALRIAVDLENPTPLQKTAGLVDSSKAEITASDARLILRAAVGLETLNLY